MSKHRILMFGTYPIFNAQHGGQQRVKAIFKNYQNNSQLSVRYVGVFQRNFFPDFTSDDIPLAEPAGQQTIQEIYTTDITIGKRIYDEVKARQAIIDTIQNFKPDIIELEQVFPYFGMRKLLRELNWPGKLIYNSQNIEAKLKAEILKKTGMGPKEIAAIVSEIETVELELTRAADLVIACTASEAEYYKQHGAKKVAIAQNGIHHRVVSKAAVEKWRGRLEKDGVTKPVLFIGSAHPPNLAGFINMVGFGLGFMPNDARLLFLGGVSDIVAQQLSQQPNYMRTIFGLRSDFIGRVSEEDLGALLKLADVIILPITEGGGSNLKTAEAILADVKIVATPHAFRSYEAYEKLPNIWIAKDRLKFQQALHSALNNQKIERSSQEKLQAGKVTWEHVLADATLEVIKL